MNRVDLDRAAYTFARGYLLQFKHLGVTPELLDEYLNPVESQLRPKTLAGVYERLLVSAQNANMRATVVGKSIGGVSELGRVLYNFEPTSVLEKYRGGWSEVLDDIERVLKPKGEIRRTTRSIWPSFCRSILSGASFLAQFLSADDFYSWVDVLDRDERSRPALPMLLSCEIHGFGFPLACDFLKELGYLNFAKPDVHLKAIFKGLELCAPDANDYEVFRAITRVSNSQRVAPYNVDKLFWLVGSGYFYNHAHIGNRGRIGTDRAEFIHKARLELGLEKRAA